MRNECGLNLKEKKKKGLNRARYSSLVHLMTCLFSLFFFFFFFFFTIIPLDKTFRKKKKQNPYPWPAMKGGHLIDHRQI